MKELHDPRVGCELCLMNYGGESVIHDSLCASRKCLAVIAGGHRKPNFILIFPKKHEMSMDKIKSDHRLLKEMQELVKKAEAELKKNYGAKKFLTTWCDGGMLLHFGGLSIKGVNSHAHCKMDVCYR